MFQSNNSATFPPPERSFLSAPASANGGKEQLPSSGSLPDCRCSQMCRGTLEDEMNKLVEVWKLAKLAGRRMTSTNVQNWTGHKYLDPVILRW